MLGACFASGGGYPAPVVGDGELYYWRELRNGDFATVFEGLLKERIRGLKCIRIIYDRCRFSRQFRSVSAMRKRGKSMC